MLKFEVDDKEYWVGHNPKLGFLIFDPLVQAAETSDLVRLYIIERNKSSPFKKAIIRRNLSADRKLSRTKCSKLLQPYAQARKRLRVTHCFRCAENLSSTDFGICANCGWIQCSCGACGCKYNKT